VNAKIDREKLIVPFAIDPLARLAQEMSIEGVLDALAYFLGRKVALHGLHLTQPDLRREFKFGNQHLNNGNDYELKIDVKGGGTQLGIHRGQQLDFDTEREISSAVQLAAHRIELLARISHRSDKAKKTIAEPSPVFNELVGDSALMAHLRQEVSVAARRDSTVLIEGETGTGKELIARAIHCVSERASGLFIPVNCGAIPESLIESELFGHEKGAFTGADKLRKGRFELAHGGMLLLDEVGELTPAAQVKLLRVLQEREFERLGGAKTIKVDVRIVAATNRDLWREVVAGRFREDLYHRLCILYIRTPALRDHPEDIPRIIQSRLEAVRRRLRYANNPHLEKEALNLFLRCPWPGNGRALEAAVERLAARAGDGEMITADLALSEISECERKAVMMIDRRLTSPAKINRETYYPDLRREAEPPKASNNVEYTAVWHPGNPVQEFFDRQLLGIYEIAISLLGNNHSQVARFLGMDRKKLLRLLGRAERRIKEH
jgi:transcriptional regulator with GAF, ATPase, and Fis domain